LLKGCLSKNLFFEIINSSKGSGAFTIKHTSVVIAIVVRGGSFLFLSPYAWYIHPMIGFFFGPCLSWYFAIYKKLPKNGSTQEWTGTP